MSSALRYIGREVVEEGRRLQTTLCPAAGCIIIYSTSTRHADMVSLHSMTNPIQNSEWKSYGGVEAGREKGRVG